MGIHMTDPRARSQAAPFGSSQQGGARSSVLMASALVAALVLAGLSMQPEQAPPAEVARVQRQAPAASAPDPQPAPASASVAAQVAVPPATPAALPSPLASDALQPAHWSMADARVNGDPRTPPLHRAAPEAQTPVWQLSDHEGHLRRELDEHRAIQQAFVEAANAELPKLEQWLALGRAQGVSAEQLAVAEEKIRRLKAQRELTMKRLDSTIP